MRKCHFCHDPIADTTRRCPHCGANLIHRRGPDYSTLRGAVRTWRERLQEDGRARVMFQSAVLFVVLVITYAFYLHGLVNSGGIITVGDLVWGFVKISLISGAPFAIWAYADREWQSENAAPVALAAWVAVFAYFSRKYGSACPFAFVLLFVPLVISALVAHKLGALRHPAPPPE